MTAEIPLIVHVVHRFGVGGLENGLVNLINRMPASEWRHAVVSLTEISEEFAKRVERDVMWIALNKRPGHLIRYYPRLFSLFRELRPAIVHTRNLAALEACVPAWAARVPARVHGEHGWDVHDLHASKRKYLLIRRAYRPFVRRYVALSQHIERYLEEGVRVPGARITQIYNGVDTERFAPPAGKRALIPGCPFDDPRLWVVGAVGRMAAVKNPLMLVHAFIRARQLSSEARSRMRLIMIGEGPLRTEAASLVADAGLTPCAWLPGERSDVPAILRGVDCFALPSLAEGISNTVLEAMATGLPIVATRAGGNAELIEDGLSGRLVPPANSDALAQALVTYLSDPVSARRHGRAARRVVEGKFALTQMVGAYERLYESLVPGRRTRSSGSTPRSVAAHDALRSSSSKL
jgi:sugar transferase (PEP-CTERM/EpsH1 system associated)